MSRRSLLPFLSLFALVIVLLAGCAAGPTPAPTPNAEVKIQEAVKTAAAIISATALSAASAPTNTPPPPATTEPPAASPTSAPALPAAATPKPVVKSASYPGCDIAGFVTDVSIPDDTEIPGGSPFTKTWRLKNIGGCAWDANYLLVFYDGNNMGAPKTQPLTSGTVNPGETIDVSLNLTAPAARGTYISYWRLRNAAGTDFGLGKKGTPFYVKIVVKTAAAAATPTPTPTSKP